MIITLGLFNNSITSYNYNLLLTLIPRKYGKHMIYAYHNIYNNSSQLRIVYIISKTPLLLTKYNPHFNNEDIEGHTHTYKNQSLITLIGFKLRQTASRRHVLNHYTVLLSKSA